MYKDILQNIENVAVWPVVSFVIFFLFFVFLLWHVFTTNKDFVKRMSDMPLEGDDDLADEKSLRNSNN